MTGKTRPSEHASGNERRRRYRERHREDRTVEDERMEFAGKRRGPLLSATNGRDYTT